MDRDISLYQKIKSAVINGELPDGFSLPQDTEDKSGLHFADGAMDGIAVYHMAGAEPGEDQCVLMERAVRAAAAGSADQADALFLQLGQEARALTMIDTLQAWVIDHRQELNAQNLWNYACHAMMDAQDRECVKFGMSLLEVFQTADRPSVRNAVRILGLSDEFTLFSVFIMRRWPDGNEEIWNLAQRVHGWGRVHAVECLEPATDAIREWLLTEGVRNHIMYSYSALTCWQKADAADALKRELTRKEFSGIRDIIGGLLDEGPVQGISAIENANDAILDFLHAAQRISLAAEDYDTIRNIGQYFENEDSSSPEIAALCKDLLHSEACRTAGSLTVKTEQDEPRAE